ncbi:putative uncharacterized protein CXorf58 homolog isoform X2 [Anguilla anguilla]|uniref:putative uncharacterized protein CXorf58 homolog isoform X2 n=1 Tax=Anguilla anguilla TaxID=7936 RepID=UPI0015AEBA0C|nr:putative uncharacterized protein CXorf58 homolog isoform X2 [Anguilla anguilla]
MNYKSNGESIGPFCSFDQEERQSAARKIQAFWRSHQDRRLFSLLLSTVRAAEHSVAPAVLCQLSPREALLLRDPSIHYKVRLRFAGSHFPPVVVFKIIDLKGGKYLSGKKLFCSSNQATAETCRIMGNRKFLDMLITDEIQSQEGKIVDMMDVLSKRDYMQFNSHLDELPAHLGGRDNGWRTVALKRLWRDILRHKRGENGFMASRLRKKLLSVTPGGSSVQGRRTPRLHRYGAVGSTPLPSSRRSSKACKMATQRKQLYASNKESKEEEEEQERKREEINEEGIGEVEKDTGRHPRLEAPQTKQLVMPEDDSTDSEWEEEVERLYSWTKGLSLSDMEVSPPDHADQLSMQTQTDRQ